MSEQSTMMKEITSPSKAGTARSVPISLATDVKPEEINCFPFVSKNASNRFKSL